MEDGRRRSRAGEDGRLTASAPQLIERDGNLACPASLSLGQHHNVALVSVPDGDDRQPIADKPRMRYN
jgi:Ni2+-binding GTPase involved in maturation of urease and hydrogenase